MHCLNVKLLPYSFSCLFKIFLSFSGQPFVRLGGSSVPLQGRVEVIHRGIWGTVCRDKIWTEVDGRVVCRELGFFGVDSHTFTNFAKTTGIMWLRDVKCDGSEVSLAFCEHNNWKDNCQNNINEVGVSCKFHRNESIDLR